MQTISLKGSSLLKVESLAIRDTDDMLGARREAPVIIERVALQRRVSEGFGECCNTVKRPNYFLYTY